MGDDKCLDTDFSGIPYMNGFHFCSMSRLELTKVPRNILPIKN